VLAGGCFGVYTVSAKRLIRGNVNMLAAVPVTLLLGGAALAPWTVPGLARLSAPRSLALVAWLGPVTVALAYWLYVAGLRRLTAATAATLSLAEPLVATALGIGILRESLSLSIAAGTLLLLGGLVLVSVPRPRGVNLTVDLQSVILVEVRGRASREVSLAGRTVAEAVAVADDQAECGESREQGLQPTSRNARFPGECFDSFRFQEAAEQVELKHREQCLGGDDP
jgi:uncharacterized membrane protein